LGSSPSGAVVAFTVVLRSERGARTVGRWADRLVNLLTRCLTHGRSVDLTGELLDFRSSVVGVMQTRSVQVTWTEALAAFSFARVARSFPSLPVPGDGGCRPGRPPHRYGATSSQALPADLVWRKPRVTGRSQSD
jgi:hypothetical protein